MSCGSAEPTCPASRKWRAAKPASLVFAFIFSRDLEGACGSALLADRQALGAGLVDGAGNLGAHIGAGLGVAFGRFAAADA